MSKYIDKRKKFIIQCNDEDMYKRAQTGLFKMGYKWCDSSTKVTDWPYHDRDKLFIVVWDKELAHCTIKPEDEGYVDWCLEEIEMGFRPLYTGKIYWVATINQETVELEGVTGWIEKYKLDRWLNDYPLEFISTDKETARTALRNRLGKFRRVYAEAMLKI